MSGFYTLYRRQRFAAPLARVFDFFSRPENLATITPPSLKFVVKTPSPIDMREGLQISYTVRPFFFPMKWTSTIESYRPPGLFVDVQTAGPYKRWRHTHRFIADGAATWVEDHVEYELPFGFLGRVAHRLIVARQLREIFDYREQVLKKVFG